LLRGREHAAGGVRWLAIFGGVALAAAVGVAAWFLFFRGGNGILGGGRETPAFHFRLKRVTAFPIDGKPSKAALRQAAKELQASLDAMYLAGFVDPDSWDDGRFPGVLEAFAPSAAGGAQRDLPDLTLGPAEAEVDSVDPGRSRLDVEFLLTESRKVFAAVATVTFRAQGSLTDGGTLVVTHRGRYVMRPIEGRWVIVSYQVDGKLRPAPPASPSPGGSP
jgi:hypothetical protein